jgi:lipopolysaccharide export system permease protein
MQIKPGTFVYLESYNNQINTGYRFSLEQFEGNRLVFKMNADQIVWDSAADTWKVKNYFIRKVAGSHEILTNGKEKDTVISMNPADFTFIPDDVKTMNFSELRAFINKEKLKGSQNISDYEVEKHKRIAFPFATLVLTLIGVSISSRKIRGGIGMHLGLGIGITFTYILFQQVSTVFATRGSLSPWLAVWIPNFIFGLLGIYLVKIAPK